ncbi:hypothetical protein JTB14_034212 [Gonioctena quinquepunctata]|nr:hypothetical protein JTB14_034212 [Gonioctena quinquepunctata]
MRCAWMLNFACAGVCKIILIDARCNQSVAMGTYEAEQARLERLMDETFDEEGLDDTDDEFINEELDVFETREEDSESEQDLSGREDLTEEDSN